MREGRNVDLFQVWVQARVALIGIHLLGFVPGLGFRAQARVALIGIHLLGFIPGLGFRVQARVALIGIHLLGFIPGLGFRVQGFEGILDLFRNPCDQNPHPEILNKTREAFLFARDKKICYHDRSLETDQDPNPTRKKCRINVCHRLSLTASAHNSKPINLQTFKAK